VECVFAVVGVHLEVLVGESTLNSLDQQHESEVRLRVIVGQGVTQGMKKLFTPQ
jgi:hypothetical protein